MSTALDLSPSPNATNSGDDLDHFYCCDEDRSLCGFDLAGVFVGEVDDDLLCVVCADLEGEPCSAADCPQRSP